MQVDPSVVKRLGFVRYLYELGMAQSSQPEPANASALLIFHDAIELFNQIGSEHLNAGSAHPSFMDYWGLLSPQLTGGSLPQMESMRRLNKARVALKHNGTLPSKLDLEAFRASVVGFFADATPLVFGLDFGELSLVDFIEAEQARNTLKQASASVSQDDFPQAVQMAALAFHQLVDDYEQRKRTRYGRSPFYFGPDFPFTSGFFMGLSYGSNELLATPDFQRKLGNFVDGVKDALEAIQDAIRILAMGIDYRRYSRFRSTARSFGRGYEVGDVPDNLAREDAEFCIGFVVETALKLQEFDWSENNDESGA
jgi:hypothetical protein